MANPWIELEQQGIVTPMSMFNWRYLIRGTRAYVCCAGSSVENLPSVVLMDMFTRGFVFGINGWVYHPVAPALWICEIGEMNCHENKSLMDQLFARRGLYHNVPILVKDVDIASDPVMMLPNHFPEEMIRNVITSREYLIPGGSRADVAAFLLDRESSGRLAEDFKKGFLPKRRGTAVYAVILAYLLGFKDVVLVGCDMTSARHFYEKENPGLHLAEDASLGIPISQVLLGVKDAFFYPESGRRLMAVFPSKAFGGEVQDFMEVVSC